MIMIVNYNFSCIFQHAVILALHGTGDMSCHFPCRLQRAVLAALRGPYIGSYHLTCRFPRAVLAALCGADGWSCHFVYISTYDTSGCACFSFFSLNVVDVLFDVKL